MTMSSTYQALNIPPAANERGGFEVLRCAIIDRELHLTLRPAFDEPGAWGRLFAEVARQVANAYAQQQGFAASETLARIGTAFETDMKNPPDFASTVGPIG
jgi:Domain of unknown function (DUF5076)